MDESGNAKPDAGLSPERRPRWGLRTLGFLGLAFIAVVTSAALGHHTVGTLGSLLFGLIGAAYCSVRGYEEPSMTTPFAYSSVAAAHVDLAMPARLEASTWRLRDVRAFRGRACDATF